MTPVCWLSTLAFPQVTMTSLSLVDWKRGQSLTNMIIDCYPRSESMIKAYYYKWWLYTPDGIKLSHTVDGTKFMSAVKYFVWDYFTSLLLNIKIYTYNIDIKWILGNYMSYSFSQLTHQFNKTRLNFLCTN